MATATAPPKQDNRRPSHNQLERDSYETAADLEVVPASSLEAQERAQIDVQIATAKKYPRGSLEAIKRQMLEYATLDEETAESCFYTLKRKERDSNEDKIIQDASVRLAEIALVCYRNLRAGSRIIENDGQRITAQGMCLDLENNVAVSMTTDRPISSKGRTWSLDMQVVTANAANAIAFRNAVFKVVPKALVKPIVEKCKQMAAGDGPIEARWQKAIRMFKTWGITEQMLLAWLEKPLDKPIAESIGDEEIASLRGLFTSFRDGELTVPDAFAGINKDGTRKESPPAHEEKDAAPAQDLFAQEESAAPDTKGPLTRGMFTEQEYSELLDHFIKAGLGNRAKFDAWLGRWKGTKQQALDNVREIAQSKQQS